MTSRTRIWLLGMVACAVGAIAAPVAQAAPEFGVERFVAVNCIAGQENCAEEAGLAPYSVPKEPSKEEAEAQGYTQAAGHPPFGITAFKINTVGTFPNAAPTGIVTHVRTDIAPGLSTNPEAVEQCTIEELGAEVSPGSGFFTAPTCKAGTVIGKNKVIVYGGPEPFPKGGDLPLEGTVYNLVQPEGRSSDFGVALPIPVVVTEPIFHTSTQLYVHTFIEGGIEWASNYHDYYEINVSPQLPLIASRLILTGNIGTGGFITNPSNCAGAGPLTTSTVTLQSSAAQTVARAYTTPIGTKGCKGESPFSPVPFEPAFKLTPSTTQSDQPDGVTTEVSLPHDPSPEGIDSSQLNTASVELPEGMTLNPSAAQGLEACTPAQARIHSRTPGMSCPTKSEIGSVALEVPDLPPGSLSGSIYLGGPESGPITGPPYTIYVDAESARYGISVRLEGQVTTDEATGRLTATFDKNPEQPFSLLALHFKGGALAPIANPLVCGAAASNASFAPFTGTGAVSPAIAPFSVDGNGSGGACASPLSFSLGQSTAVSPNTGGAASNFTLSLSRADGQQYLARVSTTLPPGLVGKIPAVPLCPEPQASLGTCSAASEIGRVATAAGSGPTPTGFSGPVFLTGPTDGAPYGMTMVVNAAAGPFSLGNVVARVGIEVNPLTAQVTVAGNVPTVFRGIPLRLKALTVAINRQGFLVNPTNCGTFNVSSLLTSSFGATQTLSTPFQASGCSSLAFKPKFTAGSGGKTSRANGASLKVKVAYPSGAQANIKSVKVTLPKQLPSRLATLKNACLEAVFNANPFACPSSSKVGGATVTTPVLPEKLTGPAFFVSHGGAAFPDLDLVLKGNGIMIILVGNTSIKKGVTTSTYASLPDVPVSSFETSLPIGKNSALAANGNLCKQKLVMPTTITAQNGKVIKQNTAISVSGCPVTVVSHAVRGNKAIVVVRAPSAGRVSGRGTHLKTVYRRPGKTQNVTLEIPITTSFRPIGVRVRVGFIPKKGASSVTYTSVYFR